MARKRRRLKSAPGQQTLPGVVPLERHERLVALRDLRLRMTADLLATAAIDEDMRRLLQAIFCFPAERSRSDRIYQCTLRQIAGRLGWNSTKQRTLQRLIVRAETQRLIVREPAFAQDGTQAGNKYRIRYGQIKRRGLTAAPLPVPVAKGGTTPAGPLVSPPPRHGPAPPVAPRVTAAPHVSRDLDSGSDQNHVHVAPRVRASWTQVLDDPQTSLDRPADVEALYRIAVAAGWIVDAEQARLWFFAAAHHTRTGTRNRRAAFTSLVKKPAKRKLLQADDEWARAAIDAIDHPDPGRQPAAAATDPGTDTDQARRRAQRQLAAWAATKGAR